MCKNNVIARKVDILVVASLVTTCLSFFRLNTLRMNSRINTALKNYQALTSPYTVDWLHYVQTTLSCNDTSILTNICVRSNEHYMLAILCLGRDETHIL